MWLFIFILIYCIYLLDIRVYSWNFVTQRNIPEGCKHHSSMWKFFYWFFSYLTVSFLETYWKMFLFLCTCFPVSTDTLIFQSYFPDLQFAEKGYRWFLICISIILNFKWILKSISFVILILLLLSSKVCQSIMYYTIGYW